MFAGVFSSAVVPVTKKPVELIYSERWLTSRWSHSIAKQQSLCCDFTVTCQLADSNVATAAQEAGAEAELAGPHKLDRYANIDAGYLFEPIAV